MWISANFFSVGSVLSTIQIVLGDTNLSLTRTSLLQIIYRFSSSFTQESHIYTAVKHLF